MARARPASSERAARLREGGRYMNGAQRIDKDRLLPYLFLLPVAVYYVIFWLQPVAKAAVESFTGATGAFTTANYTRLLSEPDIRKALVNTVVFAAGSMVVQFFLSIAIALFLNKKFKLANVLLFITLIPMAFPQAAVGILWKSGFDKYGWVNTLLWHLHVIDKGHLIDWMSFANLKAVLFLILVDTWTVVPSVVIIILAGLQGLNKEFEEAGWVFGASKYRAIKDIVIPIMRPTIATAMILRLIASIQVWLIAVMIYGYNVAPFLVERIAYNVDVISFGENSRKDAFALSVIVVAIVMAAAYAYIRVDRRAAGKAS
jgi:multiple sugar transport system permease protein